jgi:alkanesulfonate monooxygenase SsuD/methylene tetrahydromethanopterin reductase-like flavin-dependent oxidoreductase (luciferase family)
VSVAFGFGLITCQRFPGDGRSDVELYADAIDLAAEAERLGFDSVWTSEHHFVDDGYLPSVLALSAAIAVRTERVAIGTGLLLAPLHDPIRVAEDAAVVDLLSAGRTILGVGLGWRAEEFEGLQVPMNERAQRLEDSIAVYRQAWRGELVTGGEHLRYPNVAVRPLPARSGGPPIWLGGSRPAAIRRAGLLGDGFMGSESIAAVLAEEVAIARDARAAAGITADLAISVHLPTFAWNGDDAWERVLDHYSYVEWKYDDMDVAHSRTGPSQPPPPTTSEDESALRERIVLGRPDDVAEQIAAIRDAAGGELHYVARLYWPGMDPGVQREAMAVFAEEVIPKLR